MISELKLELIRKIINARLTAEELQDVTNKAQEIIDRRPGNVIPLYEQTETDGIIKEALSNDQKGIDG